MNQPHYLALTTYPFTLNQSDYTRNENLFLISFFPSTIEA